jgi:hypothetical protein
MPDARWYIEITDALHLMVIFSGTMPYPVNKPGIQFKVKTVN